MSEKKKKNIVFFHPDLGIGGAERLVIDAAVGLQNLGHTVTIFTSHRDPAHCFDEARDGQSTLTPLPPSQASVHAARTTLATNPPYSQPFRPTLQPSNLTPQATTGTLDVRIRGNTLIPPSLLSRLTILCAALRQLHLILHISVFSHELAHLHPDAFVVDQLAAGIPVLRYFWPDVRVLFYCHFPDLLLVKGREGPWGWVKRAWRVPFDAVEGWGMRGSDRVVVNSRFTGGVVGGVWPWLGIGGRVRVVYPCVDTRGGAGEGGGGKGMWKGKRVLLSVNRFERKKGVRLAIRAFAGLGERGRRGVRLVVAGEFLGALVVCGVSVTSELRFGCPTGGYDNRIRENVAYHDELVALAESLGLQCATTRNVVTALNVPDAIDVLFLLSIPASLKSMLLHAASLLIYTPSEEHFGIVPLEAMLAGVPVLAANTGGPLETVVDGQTGWLRPVDDVGHWTEVLDNVLHGLSDEQLKGMGQAGRRRVRAEFSESRMAERLDEEIDGMVNAPRQAALSLQDLLLGFGLAGLLVVVVFAVVRRLWYQIQAVH